MSSFDDPFAEENDPYRHGVTVSASQTHASTRPALVPYSIGFTRREFAKTLALAIPAVTQIGGCAHPGLACDPKPTAAEECRHRFCRYYRGR